MRKVAVASGVVSGLEPGDHPPRKNLLLVVGLEVVRRHSTFKVRFIIIV
jgi:hypothetical protein